MKSIRSGAPGGEARAWRSSLILAPLALGVGLFCAFSATRAPRSDATSLPPAPPASSTAAAGPEPGRLAAVVPSAAPGAALAPSAKAAAVAPAPDAPRPFDPSQLRQRLDDAWSVQPRQSAWSSGARHTAESKLPTLLPSGSLVRAVECRASMCRIETEHADLDCYARFARTAFLDAQTQLWNGGFYAAIVEDASATGGKVVSVAYLAPDGQTLPLPDGS